MEVQNLPKSAKWYPKEEESIEKSGGDGVALVNSAQRFMILSYFTNTDPVVLEEGQMLTVVCEFSVAGNLPLEWGIFLRMGLFDSGGFRLESGADIERCRFTGYRSYVLSAKFNNSRGDALAFSARNGVESGSLMQVLPAFNSLGSGGGRFIAEDGKSYVLTISVKKTEAKVELVGSVAAPDAAAEPLSVFDDTLHCAQFDTVAFSCLGNGVFEKIALSAVTISMDSEP